MNTKPNIIFILADDMGYGDMSLFNGGLSQTPVLDSLTGEGICLSQHYTSSPVCNPSRASFLTGRYPHRTGSIDTYDHLGGERLSVRERTIADMLRHDGYATGLFGKWHNGTIGDEYHPNRRGFDDFFGFRGGWQYYFEPRIERNGSPLRPEGKYLTDLLTDEAIGFVKRNRTKPFFLHLAYNCPHFPLEAPEEDIRPFAETGMFNKNVATLYGMIRNMDRNIGRLLETLEKEGLSDNTIVMFTSDNGPDFGGHGEGSLERFNCNFHGSKGLTYEGGIRLPMIMRWPSGLPSGTSVDAMVHFTDWLPTLLSMAGAKLPEDNLPVDGWDILPVLRGESGKVNTRRFWQFNRYYPYVGSNAAMRDGDWKLVRPRAPQTHREGDGEMDVKLKNDPDCLKEIMQIEPRSEFSYGPPLPAELYNLREDPEETNNLAEKDPVRVKRMQGELEKWFEEVEADRRECPDAVFK
ncbi:MAG: arylsulfatase [Planctomycetes bacterium]|nr:arylsulfatase [Planctomycetota bacterium]